EFVYGGQDTPIELPHDFAVLIGLVEVGFTDWSSGKPVSAFDQLANPDLDLDALRNSIPTDESKWAFDKKGRRVDPRKPAIKVPLVDLTTGKLVTVRTTAQSHVNAWRKCVQACLVCQGANRQTTAGHVPLVNVSTRPVPAQDGTAEIYVLVLETMDWIKEGVVISALGK